MNWAFANIRTERQKVQFNVVTHPLAVSGLEGLVCAWSSGRSRGSQLEAVWVLKAGVHLGAGVFSAGSHLLNSFAEAAVEEVEGWRGERMQGPELDLKLGLWVDMQPGQGIWYLGVSAASASYSVAYPLSVWPCCCLRAGGIPWVLDREVVEGKTAVCRWWKVPSALPLEASLGLDQPLGEKEL